MAFVVFAPPVIAAEQAGELGAVPAALEVGSEDGDSDSLQLHDRYPDDLNSDDEGFMDGEVQGKGSNDDEEDYDC